MKKTVIIGAIGTTILVVGLVFVSKTMTNPSQNTIGDKVLMVTFPSKTFNLDEVAKHNKVNDCWLAIEGSVYDVTKFIPNHPGGDKILLGCGKDATALFNDRHSSQAKKLLPEFLVGIVK